MVVLVLFCIAALCNLVGEWTQSALLVYASKPLLMPLLALYFYQKSSKPLTKYAKCTLLALFFSFLGDVFLMFNKTNSTNATSFFLLGLGSFLFAHLFYIIGFQSIRKDEKGYLNRYSILVLFPIGYFLASAYLLLGGIPSAMKIPVVTYAAVITTMLLTAIQLEGKLKTQWLLVGALLFVLSDSMIGFNKFRNDLFVLPNVGFWIMLTYIAGQFAMIKGILKADNEPNMDLA
jgi:uncharacterized membrane protein YhhN